MSVTREAIVDHVADGDTISGATILSDTTTHAMTNVTVWQQVKWAGRIRLLSVNAPDKGEARYDESVQFVKDRIKPGDVIQTAAPRDVLDQFGRLLADVLYNATPTEKTPTWRSLSADLVEAGLAVPMDGKKLQKLAPALAPEERRDFLGE